jgi:hypothetical protein
VTVAIAVLLVILIVAVVLLRRARAERAFAQAAVPGEAIVTDVRHKRVGPLDERDLLAYPLVRLMLPDGTTLETWAERPSREYEAGDHVEVLYLPDEPRRVRINSA